MASWVEASSGASLWVLLGFAAAAFAGAVVLFVGVGYALSFGKGSNWCISEPRLYRDAAIGGLVALTAHLPGLFMLRHRLRAMATPLASVIIYGPLTFATGSVLMAAMGHALRCWSEPASGLRSFAVSMNDAGGLGLYTAAVLLFLASIAAAALGADFDSREEH